MNEGNRRIFYDKLTGEKIYEIGRNGSFTLPTIEQDIATFTILSERNRNTFDVLELPFNTYEQDFKECIDYRVNIETKKLEFSYPHSNEPSIEQPYQAPLSEQIDVLKEQLQATQDAVDFLIINGGM